ncbi:MAG: 4-(cytidine 5'-diphospho)-2-C-methyl-D-erythritol kinase, partial [Rariglobus sp.]
NELSGGALDEAGLARVAAQLGSDCALFLKSEPVVMRGRGEEVQTLPAAAVGRLRGRRVLIFKPSFGINTAWAYRQMAAGAPDSYLATAKAETRLAGWIAREDAAAEELLFNNMEVPAFSKYVALPVALECLREEFGLAPRMSGSGSACFAFLPENAPVAAITARIRELWGTAAFVVETRLK